MVDNRLSLTIRDLAALYSAYMPFVENGGLFVPTQKQYQLGQEMFILLTLNIKNMRDTIPIAGKIIWISPPNCQGGKKAGIGIQFSDLDKGASKNKIETQLAGALQSDRPTHTM